MVITCFIMILVICTYVMMIVMFYAIYYDDWMWVLLLGPVVLDIPVLVEFVVKWAFSVILEI